MSKKPKSLYTVSLYERVYDDGLLCSERLVYRQTTWAVSERQAENNVRHNSGLSRHGYSGGDRGRCSWDIVAEVEHE